MDPKAHPEPTRRGLNDCSSSSPACAGSPSPLILWFREILLISRPGSPAGRYMSVLEVSKCFSSFPCRFRRHKFSLCNMLRPYLATFPRRRFMQNRLHVAIRCDLFLDIRCTACPPLLLRLFHCPHSVIIDRFTFLASTLFHYLLSFLLTQFF